MKKWRPEGWENPYGECGADLENMGRQIAYEAGADAILSGLKAKSPLMTPEQMKLIAPYRNYSYGWLVFIPEEKLL